MNTRKITVELELEVEASYEAFPAENGGRDHPSSDASIHVHGVKIAGTSITAELSKEQITAIEQQIMDELDADAADNYREPDHD